MKARFMASKMLGALSVHLVKPAPGVIYDEESESPINCFIKVLLVYLNSKSALQRTVIGLVMAEWARLAAPSPCPPLLKDRLLFCLNEGLFFDEIASSYTKLLQEVRDLISMLKHHGLSFDDSQYGKVLTLDQIQQLTNSNMQDLIKSLKKKQILDVLEDRRKSVQMNAFQISAEQSKHLVRTQAALAGAVLMLKCLPEKLNPVIKPLMESIKKEKNEHLQHLAALHLSQLMELCTQRQPCPNTKIITNLCALLCSDPEFTPQIYPDKNSNKTTRNCNDGDLSNSVESGVNSSPISNQNYHGIISLVNRQKMAEKTVLKGSCGGTGAGPGRPPKTDIPLNQLLTADDETQKQNQIQQRGASYAFNAIVSHFGAELPKNLPDLWEIMVVVVKNTIDLSNFDAGTFVNNNASAETLITSLQVLEVTIGSVDASLLSEVKTLLPHICLLITHPYSAVRHLASRCLAALSKIDSSLVMKDVINKVLLYLGASDCDSKREGAIEAIACILEKMQFEIIPYIVFLIVPLLGRMSDQLQHVRLLATDCFATLIQLMPLDGGAFSSAGFSEDLFAQKEQERLFLEHLFNPKTIPNYEIPVKINCQLRSYQQAGVNWLAFLNRYKLHGILCDDMGLGKTLQSICILAGDHYTRSEHYKLKKSADCAPLPSLVICPPTLTGHWVYEVDKFVSRKYLNPLLYGGPPQERERLRTLVNSHNLIVASYEIVRKDVQFFSSIKWNYCILDEGHIIKNGKTKSSKAIKQLHANHRLILSGTPIQNNVLELWSLFDFLMPGFLGTEKQFNARYSRPILASRDAKSSAKEQEAGVLAMEALHRQVLPFVLRRMKEDVLTDLPPKITQDYYCDLSPLQMQLYEDFSKSHAHQSLTNHIDSKRNSNIFQALRYLQNVCNHPKLVLSAEHPQYERITSQLREQDSSLSDIQHAAKLPALQQLLLDCGIGAAGNTETPVINQHRALIFCQLKAMLDILENDLFKTTMKTVSYLRLDGSVPHSLRHSLVTRFNNDPSIDVLLLTTQVGGLGLNLTGADTVIFVEHDWSPMKDLQAMDRAHRIGQKKVVNVYRLITRATLEEKIMGLQKFKLMTANTVISSENASLETMGTDKLLDLFTIGGQSGGMDQSTWSAPQSLNSTPGSNSSMKVILDSLPDLWDDKDYEEEYDLTNFVRTLKQ
ncbi:unnamed protein product [Bemisia tabaci]|uniref:TATA-binding protein-associated factor 172 n=2 Tax=Bemisia tabaci TaxID=7038 RepID=A0A9P0F2C2_BEMTA|nr:unnamed protein product [Bemisia tabaci]